MVAHRRFAPLACSACALFLIGCAGTGENAALFHRFQESAYLQDLWAETCSFPLTEESLVLLASINFSGNAPRLVCDWSLAPVGASDSGITLAEGVTDLDARWVGCGRDAAFPNLVWDAVRNPGSNVVHLGEGLSSGSQSAVVLIAKCHYWDDYYCTIKRANPNCSFPHAAQILSMAYAVLDAETGEILW
ncbi:MAG: hypothetical protein PHU04_00675 [Candidatus Peribacteraceae bacterium]|nr:hypothetical protein [Candidatus Peribacteraceae bacterium]